MNNGNMIDQIYLCSCLSDIIILLAAENSYKYQ